MSDQLSSIRGRLESRGYSPMQGVVESAKDHWYRHDLSTARINHVLYLSHKPMADAYSIRVGVYDSIVKTTVESKIQALAEFIEPTLLKWPAFINSPCWHMFDAGRALQWGTLLITPLPRDPESWPEQIDALFDDFLMPIFFPIQDARGIMELLLRNDRPFEWFASSPVLRISEIVSLGKLAQISPILLRDRIQPFAAVCNKRIPGGKFDEAVDAIFKELYI